MCSGPAPLCTLCVGKEPRREGLDEEVPAASEKKVAVNNCVLVKRKTQYFRIDQTLERSHTNENDLRSAVFVLKVSNTLG